MNNKENVNSTGPPSQLEDESSAAGQLELGKRKHEEPSSGLVANEARQVWYKRCQEYHREFERKGTTQKEFAKTHGLPNTTFHRWWTKYKKEKGLLPTAGLWGSCPTVAMYQEEGNGNTTDRKRKATTQNTRNEDRDSDRRQTKPQEPPLLPPPQPAGTVRGNPQPVEALPPAAAAAAVAIKTEDSDDRPVSSTYRYFRVASDDEASDKRLVRLHETWNDTYTFHDLRHAIQNQLSCLKETSFQFTLVECILDPQQDTWNVNECIRVDSGADGSIWTPYQVTIKVLPLDQPKADTVGSNLDV